MTSKKKRIYKPRTPIEKSVWVFDFETFTIGSDYYKEKGHLGVGLIYGKSLYTEDDFLSTNLNDFISFLKQLSKRQAVKIYFHNARFDMSYLLETLMKELVPVEKSTKGGYTQFVNQFGTFYWGKFKFLNGKYLITIVDSYKLLHKGVKALAEFTPYKKLNDKLDVTKLPYVDDIKDMEPIWIEYIKNDVLIIRHMLIEWDKSGLSRGCTIASSALSDFKLKLGYHKFMEKFACIGSLGEWQKYAKSYHGGFTYANPKFKGKREYLGNGYEHGLGMMLDIKSSYPNQCVNFDQPYGNPTFKTDETTTMLEIELTYIKVHKDKIPCFTLPNNKIGEKKDNISELNEKISITIWEKEWNYLKTIYDFNFEIVNQYHFNVDRTLSKWFEVMFNKRQEYKAAGNRAMEEIIKLYINSLTGKFGQNPISAGKIWKTYVDKELSEKEKLTMCNNINHTRTLELKTRKNDFAHECVVQSTDKKFSYVPLIAHITSGARIQLFEYINYKNNNLHFRYCDTDSALFCCQDLIELPPRHTYGEKLGNWSTEMKDIYRLHVIREKAYWIENKEKKKIRVSGLDTESQELIKWHEFKVGYKATRLKNKRMDNGNIALIDSVFEIKGDYVRRYGRK